MDNRYDDMEKEIFEVNNAAFEALALKIFLFQYNQNNIYRQFCASLNIAPKDVNKLDQIPFLPIQFFKTKKIHSTNFTPELVFESSGTTGSINSRHELKKKSLYETSFKKSFDIFYNGVDLKKLCIIGLLPSYLERESSSLVYMVNELIQASENNNSGFYLYEYEKLHQTISENEALGIPTLLIGVTYALLDYAQKYPQKLKHTIIMETGGMKGRREELTREEVHEQLKNNLGLTVIHSEYGMTELLSQAYSTGQGLFKCPPWLKILVRAEDDPFMVTESNSIKNIFTTGLINIIDLANLFSCAFIATDDIGNLYPDASFEVLGRLDNSDIRGCGLMIL